MSGRRLEGLAQAQDAPKIDWQEIRWLVVAIFAVLLIVQAPYTLAFLSAPPGHAFSGTIFNPQDANSYLSKIRQGTTGNWLFYDLYTPEPHRPGPLFLLHIAWGKVGALLNTSPPVTLAIARLAHGLILLVTLYWFLTLLLPKRSQRQTAFLLLAFSSGLGWLLLPFGEATVLGDPTPDFWMPEVSTFFTIFIFPHFAAATSLMLLTFIGWKLALRDESIAPALGAALSAFLLAWIHPFLLVPVYAVTAAYLVWQGFRHREVPWRGVGTLMLCVLVSLPVVAYIQFGLMAPNPVFRGWMEQNALSSPNALAYLLGFGLLVPLALTGAVQAISRQKGLDPLPLVWIVVGSLLLYAPTTVQRRLAEGLQIPLGVLAAVGWHRFRASLRARPLLRTLLTAMLVCGLVMSTLLNWTTAVANVLNHAPTVFITQYQLEAMAWLREHSSWRDTVLSSYWSGSYIPAWAGNRVVMGHWAETIELDEKMRDAKRFFDGSTSSLVRSGIVRRYQVHYLYYSPYERHLGDYDPGSDPDWMPVFANEEITIYRHILAP